VLLEASGATRTATVTLQVADDPCLALLSSTGLLARTPDAAPLPGEGDRTAHDVLVSVVRTTVRGEVGVVTSLGRLIRVQVVDLPTLPPSANPPSLSGGHPVSEYVSLQPDETVIGLGSLDPDSPGLAIGTAQGIVKRVVPDYPANRDDFEVITLKDGDTVVGAAELDSEDHDLVFITSDAQLLRFQAALVRPQGRPAGGMAGIRLDDGARVVWFGVVDPSRPGVVVTVAGSSTALPGTQVGGGKVSDYAEYPAKGRATGGVRTQRFLKGEDVLLLAWAGAAPAKAVSAVGKPVPLPEEIGRRDGSGVRLTHTIGAIGGALAAGSETPAEALPASQEDGQD
jgi:DNA gyrase subunit A